MPQSFKYPTSTLFLSDYIIGTDSSNSQENVTRNFKVSEIVNTILAAINIGTVTSISTVSSTFINMVSAPSAITTVGTITPSINATGLAATAAGRKLQYLRGDNTWQLPGPTPTEVIALDDGTQLTADLSSINFTGNVSATGGTSGFITVNFPGATALIDSIIAGAGITFTNNIGAVTINNAGVIQTRAGGNVTLSGGTGNVTVSTVANAGTLISISPGTGIATIANSTSNPELDVEYIGTNNYIAGNLDATVINEDDFINYHQTPSSNVKRTQLRNIPASILTALTTYIDDADLNKIKNVEPAGFDETAKAKYMVTCTLNDYNAIATKDVNTLYFIVGAGISYTQNLTTDVSGITGSSNYSITTLANGVSGTSVSGPAGTAFSFQVSISGTNGATISNSNMPLTISGSIAINGGTSNAVLTATVTNAASNSVRAKLNNIIYTAGADNLGTAGALGTIWEYEPAVPGNGYNVIGDFSPTSGYITSMPYDYSFTPRVKLKDTNTYKWALGEDPSDVKYLKYGYFISGVASNYELGWASGQVSSNGVNITQDVSHEIQGFYQLKTSYSASLTVNDNVTVVDANGASIGNTPTYSWGISGGTLPSFNTVSGSVAARSTGTVSGLNITSLNNLIGSDQNSFKWTDPSSNQPTITESDYSWTTPATFVWTSSGTSTPDIQTISGANGSDTLNIAGQITYAPVIQGTVVYVPTYIINGSSTSSLPANVNTNLAAGTTTGSLQISPTAVNYSITPNPPTITAGSGYTLTNVSVTNTGIPLSGSMAGKSSTNNSTWDLTGTLAIIPAAAINPSSTVTLTAPPQGGYQVSYSVTFQYKRETGQQDTRTRAMTASASSPYTATVSQPQNNMAQSPTSNFGELTIVINRTGYGSNIAGDAGSILISKNGGSTLFSYTITQGNSVSGVQYTVTGLTASSDYVTISIAEG